MLPVSADFIEDFESPAFSCEDIVGGFCPDEWLGLGVVLQQVVVDGGLQITDAGVAAASDAFRGDFGEEAFDEVQPGRAGRREMQMETWMLR